MIMETINEHFNVSQDLGAEILTFYFHFTPLEPNHTASDSTNAVVPLILILTN